jgi:hypothetical protein
MVFNNNLLLGAAGAGGGYIIDQSILFEPGDSPGLNRAWASGSRTTATLSAWFKLGLNDNTNRMLATFGATSGTANDYILVEQLGVSKVLQVYYYNSGVVWRKSFSQVLRDPSAWYHLVVTFDTTNGTADDRVIPYLNGSRVTAFAVSSNPTASANQPFNVSGGSCYIGKEPNAAGYFDGYMAEINFVDGTALAPTSFGKVNSITGQWVPIKYTGAYGTNGFYITGEDSADLGADYSGNGNDFTSSGLTSAAQVTDTPTDDAANNIGNYAVWNPLEPASLNGDPTFSNGNRTVTIGGAGADAAKSSIAIPTSGKWYFEATATIGAGNSYIGIADKNGRLGDGPASCRGYGSNGTKDTDTSASAYGDTFATNDIIGVAVNMDSGTIEFYKNNTSQGIAFTDLITAGVTWFINCRLGTGGAFLLNTGQTAFAYTPPTGFKRLCTANLPEPTIKDGSAHFQTTLYTGNGTAIGSGGNAISQSGNSTFQPDFAWIKGRSGATEHVLTDAVRGVTKELSSNDAGAEETVAEGLTTFGSAGFTVGSDGSYNTSSATYAAWQWKANGAGSSNTDGTINTTATSANTTAGFSLVTYVGNGTSGATVGHGLGVAPNMIIVKNRDQADAWQVYHSGNTAAPETDYLVLDTTAATADNVNRWNDTAPTSSVFSLGNAVEVNTSSENYVAYCFAEVEGFSSFGSYTGNGSTDGPMVNCGFRPAFVMTKRTNSTSNWAMWDTARDTFNVANKDLVADATNAEPVNSISIDILSNGFKLRTTSNPNASGGTYIYMAFAEHPFGGANTAPATAR